MHIWFFLLCKSQKWKPLGYFYRPRNSEIWNAVGGFVTQIKTKVKKLGISTFLSLKWNSKVSKKKWLKLGKGSDYFKIIYLRIGTQVASLAHTYPFLQVAMHVFGFAERDRDTFVYTYSTYELEVNKQQWT